MRPMFKSKAQRLYAKADQLEKEGAKKLSELKNKNEESYLNLKKTVLHILMGYGGKDAGETETRIVNEFSGSDQDIVEAIATVMRQDGNDHTDLQVIEGFAPNGMSVMAMAANTGCNTVYGSTPPNVPHTYPWMNSLFQDGATIGWLMGESFIKDHSYHSVIPERLADILLSGDSIPFTDEDYFSFTHFSDTDMNELEIMELPKIWVIGGDGGLGDIGFQNLSKVVLQNRPNVNILMLDTQVYSNTGGQNSDSSPMAGGFDMNQLGDAVQGKLTEMKSVSEALLGGHGSPFIAQISQANTGSLFKALVDGLTYRGTSFYQAYTTCQPEHGVPDHASQTQARLVRDSRGMPEFVFNPQLGESYPETLNVKGNPEYTRDWYSSAAPVTRKKYTYTVAHWAFTEARFRLHHRVVKKEDVKDMVNLEDILQQITMDDIVQRNHLDKNHRGYIPDFRVYVIDYDDEGNEVYRSISRHMVIFCVERRKAWRMLQSRAGIENKDYLEQKEMLAKLDSGEPINEEPTDEEPSKEELKSI